jgi:hypothetical protein
MVPGLNHSVRCASPRLFSPYESLQANTHWIAGRSRQAQTCAAGVAGFLSTTWPTAPGSLSRTSHNRLPRRAAAIWDCFLTLAIVAVRERHLEATLADAEREKATL